MTLHRECTLLELIQLVSESAQNDNEVVATVAYLRPAREEERGVCTPS